MDKYKEDLAEQIKTEARNGDLVEKEECSYCGLITEDGRHYKLVNGWVSFYCNQCLDTKIIH